MLVIRQCFQRQRHSPQQQQSSSSTTIKEPAHGICLAIGPERGWTDDEAMAFDRAGFTMASLGPGILRTDTAAIAAVALAPDVLLEPTENCDGDDALEETSETPKRARVG